MAADDSNNHKVVTYPPTFRTVNLNALCRQIDNEMDKPEVVYRMSNGREYKSTDRTTNGFYKP